MPAARFGSGLRKIRKGLFSTGLTKVKAGYMYVSGAWNKVWSFGSEVSYYDGDTLIGKEDVDEGHSVLHPSLTIPQKENYTFVGWANTSDGEPLDELLATGDPMNVYAIYLPNTLTVFSGDRVNGTYTISVKDTKYVNGGFIAVAARAAYIAGTGPADGSASFSITLNGYQQASVSGRSGSYGNYGDTTDMHGYYDGTEYTDSNFNRTHNVNGSHSLQAHGSVNNHQSNLDIAIWIKTITLSNPTPWT